MALQSLDIGIPSATGEPVFDAITTSAAGTTVITGTFPGLDNYTSVELFLVVTATSGTNPTLDVYIQKLCADGATFTDLVHFGQYTTASVNACASLISQTANPYTATDATLAANTVKQDHIGNTWRIKYVVGGTTPVYTFQLFGNFYV